ncbi:MAG: hypothetical protein EA397_05525 [Deltaproteobacteria bacterium]|nr:MAG: hypothetical protein EA397_05525 [Deltaproteobacteria bacterium]
MLVLLSLLSLSSASDPSRIDRALRPVTQSLEQILDGEPAARALDGWGLPPRELKDITERLAGLPPTDLQGYAMKGAAYRARTSDGQDRLIIVATANDGPPAIARMIVSSFHPPQNHLKAAPDRRRSRILRRASRTFERFAHTLKSQDCTALPLGRGTTYPRMGKFDYGEPHTQEDLNAFCQELSELGTLELLAIVAIFNIPFERERGRTLGLSLEVSQDPLKSNLDLLTEHEPQ